MGYDMTAEWVPEVIRDLPVHPRDVDHVLIAAERRRHKKKRKASAQ